MSKPKSNGAAGGRDSSDWDSISPEYWDNANSVRNPSGRKQVSWPFFMEAQFHKFIQAFIPLFVAIDPIGMSAIFLALGASMPPERRQRIARQATLTGGLVALGFLFLGQYVFHALGITVSDFQIAGGLILFILATRELVQSVSETETFPEDFGVVPLGMPLIAGPATTAALLVLAQTLGTLVTLIALAVNLTLVMLGFRYSGWLSKKIGATGLRAVSKIIAMLLAAIAVNMIRRGWMAL